ncbi:Tm-1-like ATP-binding domain-containing protein [Aspergillus ruber CBS 135680]|uniref:Uncharacterized protein n=1 Tax=Aspergillus ruber (strain CBS 135680) TaxID=1388766 RepID=A0A017S2F4_ASPRC|nr:uncharacterized protein EURHEDRAFT_406245 [Aspergillus ruber CBS 135680]EYE91218.1 hypothetical protein EURHEDRAFT_406245 [Aspergillus ruber CBS 135680]
MTTILLLGTCDTKLDELRFVRDKILTNPNITGTKVILLDLGRSATTHPDITITHHDLLSSSDSNVDVSNLSRSEYIKQILALATTTVSNLYQSHSIHAAISIGGSCGTSLATGIMQNALPVGFPKLMVSTMASGDVKSYVEETDITMMYSVVDIAGRNWVLERILGNAAGAISGMAASYLQNYTDCGNGGKKRIGITMFGVTTPCVDRVREYFDEQHTGKYEIYVFHATGAGGKAMERLIAESQLDAILDLTTTEVADELVGGILSAGPGRLSAASAKGIPQVISVGACDMVNFGTKESVPTQFGDGGRRLYEHNPSITLMRTTEEECRGIARFIGEKLRGAKNPEKVQFVLPTGGVSMLDMPGQAFHDTEADKVLFDTLEQELAGTSIEIRRDARAINDPGFAVAVAESLLELMQLP